MEKVVRKTTRGDITKTILNVVKVTGLISVALVAPNVISTFSKLGFLGFSKESYGQINRARNRLLKEGYLIKDKNGFLRITEKGSLKLNNYLFEDYKIVIPRVWDKKWRVIIFDIPESKRFVRDGIRRSLVAIGFVRLQASVWVFPYDCSEFISLLKADLKIGRDVLYMTVEHIEADSRLKKAFNLN